MVIVSLVSLILALIIALIGERIRNAILTGVKLEREIGLRRLALLQAQAAEELRKSITDEASALKALSEVATRALGKEVLFERAEAEGQLIRAFGAGGRVFTFLPPGEACPPGRRYLVDGLQGDPLAAEKVAAAALVLSGRPSPQVTSWLLVAPAPEEAGWRAGLRRRLRRVLGKATPADLFFAT